MGLRMKTGTSRGQVIWGKGSSFNVCDSVGGTNWGAERYKTMDKWSGKWKAQITHNYKNIFLGRYTNLIDARAAYLRKYNEINGENFNGRI